MSYNKKVVLRNNIEAIRTVLLLEAEKRIPSKEEREILGRYNGFGGLKCVLNPASTLADRSRWAKSELELFPMVQELQQVIKEGAANPVQAKLLMDSIKSSVLTSFYTDTRVTDTIASSFADNGIKFETFLDPSVGMGSFINSFGKSAEERFCFEKDLLTGMIMKALNSTGKVFLHNRGFEEISPELMNRFDCISSNIPFGNYVVYDRAYSKSKEEAKVLSTRAIHNYFFVKGLDTLREGGILAFITSQGLLDSPSNKPIREYLMNNSSLVSAIRLPENLFTENAGTEVGSDLIVLQKNTGKGIVSEQEHLFIETVDVPDPDNPDKVLFTHNAMFATESMENCVATSRKLSTNPYGKKCMVYNHEGGIEGICSDLKLKLDRDISNELSKGLFYGDDDYVEKLQGEMEAKQAFTYMPREIADKIPALYETDGGLIGDKVAYITLIPQHN